MYMNRVSFGMLLIFLIIFSIGPVIANNHLAKDNGIRTENKINQKSNIKDVSVHEDCFQEAFNKAIIHSLFSTEEFSPKTNSSKKNGCKIIIGANGKKAKVNCETNRVDKNKDMKPAAKKCAIPQNEGEFVRVLATAYTDMARSKWCSGRTALNTKPRWGVVAVDPRVIPLGSKIYIKNMGWFTAEDTGGIVKGKRIDIYYPTRKEALRFGVKKLNIKVIPKKRKNYKL